MKRRLAAILCTGILGISLLTGGCGGSAKDGADSGGSYAANDTAMQESPSAGAMDTAPAPNEKSELQTESSTADSAAPESGEAASLDGSAASVVKSQNQKLIFTYNYSVETKEFDSFYEKISKKTEQIGGYVENSETNGSVSDGINRYATLTLRIPANQMNQMLSLIDSDSNVTYQSRSSENVTLRYVDMESHLKALRIEQETLLQLMEKADKLKDVIALQSQLTQIRYEIESYESQLRMYDNLVEYSTLYLNITEVERTTNVASAKTTFFEEISNLFSDNLYGVGQWLRAAVIWLIGSLPILVPLAVIIAAVIFFLAKKRRRIRNYVPASPAEPPVRNTTNEEDPK